MQFHKQSFNNRFKTMGDTAEGVYDLVYPRSHALGLNRPPFTMTKMTAPMRYTPDRLTATTITEVMGIGRDGTLKIKVEKLDALHAWEHIGPVNLFVYDQEHHSYYEAPLEAWHRACQTYAKLDSFPEGKEFYALYYLDFPCDAHEAPEALDVCA